MTMAGRDFGALVMLSGPGHWVCWEFSAVLIRPIPLQELDCMPASEAAPPSRTWGLPKPYWKSGEPLAEHLISPYLAPATSASGRRRPAISWIFTALPPLSRVFPAERPKANGLWVMT